jgi:hypothetical protein
MTTSADLGIPFIDAGQGQPEVTHNEALLLLQAVTNGVIDRGVNDPPVGPTIGDSYIIGAAPTGAWAGRANCVTIWSGTAWDFIPGETSAGTPITMGARQEGMCVWVRDENTLYVWTGTEWLNFASTPATATDYGQRAITGNTTTIAITAAVDPTLSTNSDYIQITGIWNAPPDGENNNITQQTNTFTIATDGVYRIEAWLSLTASQPNTAIAIKFGINGAIGLGRRPKVYIRNSGEVHSLAPFGYHHFDAGDVVSLWFASDKTANITFEDGVFGAVAMKYDT